MGKRTKVKVDPDDPQRHLVYAWEDRWLHAGENTLTQAQTRRLLRRCFRRYGVKEPTIGFLPRASRVWSEFDTKTDAVTMNYSQCNEFVVCHEAAHVIVFRKYGDEMPDHGTTFMGIYLALLQREKVAPTIALLESAQEAGLAWLH